MYMKVFISADLEGIWGVVSRKQTEGENPDYTRARLLMTREVNLLCESLFQQGVTEIVVNDSHNTMDNLLVEDIHPDVSLISGYPKHLSMMEGIDGTFNCAMLIGYHSKVGTARGIFDHTYAEQIVEELSINGNIVGEAGLNALVAGHFGVPVVLVAGDDKVTRDVLQEIGPIETVAVKQSISRYCAKNLSYNQLKAAYETAVARALKNIGQYPVNKPKHLTLKLRLGQTVMAEKVTAIPGVKCLDALTVTYEAVDAIDLYNVFRAIVTLASSSA
jgi:D-amino peptidase